jgi:hypothetical protein
LRAYFVGRRGNAAPDAALAARTKAADHLLAFRPDPFEPPDAIQAADELEPA